MLSASSSYDLLSAPHLQFADQIERHPTCCAPPAVTSTMRAGPFPSDRTTSSRAGEGRSVPPGPTLKRATSGDRSRRRSGERRGGEEGRSRGAPDHLKKKTKKGASHREK